MTLAAARKVTSRLTSAQKRKLAEELMAESVPALPPNPTMKEIRRRADEVIAGTAKTISREEFTKSADRLLAKIRRAHAARPVQ
jgi:hypothetical protein